jgi:epoxide hydrolase-like predicted phosphatase
VSQIQAVVSDFGGVLTAPLVNGFMAFQQEAGIPLEAFGQAMAVIATRHGTNPLFELETGRMDEASFLDELSSQLSADLGRPVELHGFGKAYLEHLEPNQRLIAYMRELRDRGYRMAICTNNIREWEQLWRAKLPVDEIFEVVIDSSAVGTRKPERRIYDITLEQLGVPAEATLFLDDLEINCEAARKLGMKAVWFRDNDQAIPEIEAALDSA